MPKFKEPTDAQAEWFTFMRGLSPTERLEARMAMAKERKREKRIEKALIAFRKANPLAAKKMDDDKRKAAEAPVDVPHVRAPSPEEAP